MATVWGLHSTHASVIWAGWELTAVLTVAATTTPPALRASKSVTAVTTGPPGSTVSIASECG